MTKGQPSNRYCQWKVALLANTSGQAQTRVNPLLPPSASFAVPIQGEVTLLPGAIIKNLLL